MEAALRQHLVPLAQAVRTEKPFRLWE